MLERELNIDFFRKNGYSRYKCKKCGAYFWSKVPRDTCTEAPCGTYTFLEEPVFSRKYSVEEMRREFIEFFRKIGHTPIKRYPVVARWRDDVFLVNASIYDFQPHVTSGLVPPPANPLVISQPCIRMVDVDSVGKTGRHLTGFEMMAHHAFNSPEEWIYWKDETVEYAVKFIESLGGNEEDIVFKEKPWVGGGNAGASYEVIVGGLELATLVFMNLKEDPNGDVELEGVRYSEMPLKIVDTGYGLERFVWASQGTPTIYDAIYPDIIARVEELVGIERGEKEMAMLRALAMVSPRVEIEDETTLRREVLHISGASVEDYEKFVVPLQKIYAVVDYTRSLAFMLTDGIVPSNVQAGYLARLLIRRTLRLLDELENPISLGELVSMHVNRFSDIMNRDMLSIVLEELELEEERYRKTLKRGGEIVRRLLKRKGKIGMEDLVVLYDSHGLLPQIVKSIAMEMGVKVEIPKNFHSMVAKRHETQVREKERKKIRKFNLPQTKLLYYEDSYLKEFTAKVIWSRGNEVVLDRTAFYPEGGGQPGDHGWIIWGDRRYEVKDVQKYGGVVVHITNVDALPVGTQIRGLIDWERREQLMRNHTAEHVLLATCRAVLGRHVWQHGTQKDVGECRFDIAHYKPITRDEVKRIEEEALKIITSNVPVEPRFMNRTDAEKKYGFVLYEGGIPPGKEIRVVKIGDYDVEACGGTHVRSTGEIGILKILRTERIQDGVSRIIYTSSRSALRHMQGQEEVLLSTSRILRTPVDKIEDAVKKLQDDWKNCRKEVDKLKSFHVENLKNILLSKTRNGKLVELINEDITTLQRVSMQLSKILKSGVLLSHEGYILVFGENAPQIAREVAKMMNGKAGGKGTFARGKGAPTKIEEGLNKARELLGLK